ncbi:MAG: hypothetical protein ABTQ34_07365 [Bdellovibrionales bacterium]
MSDENSERQQSKSSDHAWMRAVFASGGGGAGGFFHNDQSPALSAETSRQPLSPPPPTAPSGRPRDYNAMKADSAQNQSQQSMPLQPSAKEENYVGKNPAFDPQKLASAVWSRAHDTSTHMCAKYVRQGFQSVGFNMSGHPGTAGEYASTGFLAQKGFVPIAGGRGDNFGQQNQEYKPQMGDVAVMQRGQEAGHIAVYCGSGPNGQPKWASDFKQKDMLGGPKFRTNACKVTVYRHNSLINPAPSKVQEMSQKIGVEPPRATQIPSMGANI